MRHICSLITAATDMGQKKPGTELAGDWLKVRGFTNHLKIRFRDLEDLGNLFEYHDEEPQETLESKLKRLAVYSQRLSQVVKEQLESGRMMMTLGGDHSVAAGTLAGSLDYNPDIKVVWVDAHADLNTPATSPSGNTHGMPVAIAMGLIPQANMQYIPKLKPENIVYIGLRDVDSGETAFIQKLGIKSFYATDVHTMGIETVLSETMEYLDPNGTSDIHLSFDVDAIDPVYFPATGTPVPEGLSLADGKKIINFLRENSHLVAFDLVEINPLLGNQIELDQTYRSTLELIDGLEIGERVRSPHYSESSFDFLHRRSNNILQKS